MDNDDTEGFFVGMTVFLNPSPPRTTVLGEQNKMYDNVIEYDFINKRKKK